MRKKKFNFFYINNYVVKVQMTFNQCLFVYVKVKSETKFFLQATSLLFLMLSHISYVKQNFLLFQTPALFRDLFESNYYAMDNACIVKIQYLVFQMTPYMILNTLTIFFLENENCIVGVICCRI